MRNSSTSSAKRARVIGTATDSVTIALDTTTETRLTLLGRRYGDEDALHEGTDNATGKKNNKLHGNARWTPQKPRMEVNFVKFSNAHQFTFY